MHITQTQLEQRSSHASQSRHNVSENLRAWIGDQRPDFSDGSQGTQPRVNISSAALDALKQDQAKDNAAKSANQASGKPASSVSSGIDLSDDDNLDPRLRILKAVVEMLTGETIHLVGTRELGDLKAAALPPSAQAAASQAPPPEQPAPKQGYGVEYDYSESVYESETTSFSAQGTVRTADGQEINFSANLTMSREFQATYNARLRLGDAKLRDPLVLNFNGQAAQLSELRIDFDLYGDGQKGSLPFVSSGSGFLVFDRNGDGKVNDGRELFGPSTGDGFAELAALDTDGNGWIDEADPAFAHLGTWTLGPDGPVFKTLAEQGIGALSVTGQLTPFSLKDKNNQLQAQIRATGVFLHESGAAGTIQQVDVAA